MIYNKSKSSVYSFFIKYFIDFLNVLLNYLLEWKGKDLDDEIDIDEIRNCSCYLFANPLHYVIKHLFYSGWLIYKPSK